MRFGFLHFFGGGALFGLGALKSLVVALGAVAFASGAWGYSYNTSSGQVVVWSPGTVSLKIMVDDATVLSDGTTRAGSIVAAAQAWNAQIATVQFSPQIAAVGTGGSHNGINEVFFTNTVYGSNWGFSTLGVTVRWFSGTQATEGDVLFNPAFTWDSYRGNLGSQEDIRRVALHELGHLLGLDHPDLHGQSVTAVMNSTISDIDVLTADDIAGAQSLYGVPLFAPAFNAHPSTQSANVGQNVAFNASASGSPAPTYRWQRLPAGGGSWADLNESGSYSGTTTAALAVSEVTAGMNGDQFRCVATNSVGSTNSNAASLFVDGRPVITALSNPRQVLNPAQGLNLSVTATDAISYQWIHNGQNVGGATGPTYSVPSVTPADGGWYAVMVGNSYGVRRSALIFVLVAPALTQVVAWGDYNLTGVPSGLTHVVALEAGANHALAVNADGTVTAWGSAGSGQTLVPGGLTGVVAVSGGTFHSLALKSDGTVVTWGSAGFFETTVPAGLSDVVAISAGNSHSLALKSDGIVVGWGYNFSAEATAPPGLSGVIAISAGTSYSLALKSDGTVVGWGYNPLGQATVPAFLTDVIAIAAGDSHSLALKADGTVVAWGSNSSGQTAVPAGLNNVIGLALGYGHSMALKADGTVVAWGSNNYGQTSVPSDLARVAGITSGNFSGVALRDATGETAPTITIQPVGPSLAQSQQVTFSVNATGVGTLSYQWRKNSVPIADATSASYTIASLAYADAGDYDVIVTNYIGSTPSAVATLTVNSPAVITNVSPARQIVNPGANLTLSVTATGVGTLSYQWTRNGLPLPGATGSTHSVASASYGDAGWYHVNVTDSHGTKRSTTFFVAIRHNGTAVPARQLRSWGLYPDTTPAQTDILAIAASSYYSLALRTNGTVVGWGQNNSGEISIPVGLSDAIALAAGGSHALALKSDGTVVGWGDNNVNETNIPSDLGGVVDIAAGDGFSVALKSDGTVVAWGVNYAGQTSVPPGLSGVVAIAARGSLTLALKSDGTIVGWGGSGASNIPTGLFNIIAVAAGGGHSLALRSDGTVVDWGSYYNEFNPPSAKPSNLAGVVAIAAGADTSFAIKGDGSVVGWGDFAYLFYSPGGAVTYLDQVLAVAGGSDCHFVLRDASVDAAPVVSVQPTSQTLKETQTASFTATVSGAGPWSFQWRKNTVDIPSANGASLNLPDVSVTDGGSYDVVVSNYVGSTISNAVTLNIIPIPAITYVTGPRQVVPPGQTLNLTISATGTGSLTYQWIHHGKEIAGATGPSYLVPNATRAAAGWYFVMVTDSNGTRRSKTFFVTIAPAVTEICTVGTDPLFGLLNVPPGLNDVVDISASITHCLALRSDGTVVGWGLNNSGQLSGLEGLTNVVAIATGRGSSMALTADGRIGWGAGGAGAALTDVVAIAAGTFHSVALRANGTVVAWGGQAYSGVSDVPAGLSGVVAIAAGDDYSLALKSDGTLVIWGQDIYHNVRLPAGLNDIASISGGSFGTVAVKNDGTVVGWAYFGSLLYSIPAGLSDPVVVAASGVSIALRGDGTAIAWNGFNNAELVTLPPEINNNVVAIAPGSYGNVLFILRDPAVPVFTTGPAGQSVPAGAGANFIAAAHSNPAPTLQWQRLPAGSGIWSNLNNGGIYSGVTTTTLTVSNVSLGMNGDQFRCVATNSVASTSSNPASLTVTVFGAGLGDFNADGKSDILLTNTVTGDRAVWLMNGMVIGAGAYLPAQTTNWVFSGIGDFDSDGKSDIILSDTSTGDRAIWLMNGTSIKAGEYLGALSLNWSISGTGDFNGDGKSDILLTDTVTGDRALWLMNGTSIQAGVYLPSQPISWEFSGIGDFDGDGKSDILLTDTTTGDRAIWLMDGTSIKAGVYLGVQATVWTISGIGDFNADGKSDVLLTNTATGDRAMWLMNGAAIGAGAYLPAQPTSWVFSRVGDFNGDGKADIFLTNIVTGDRAVWLMNGTSVSAGQYIGVLPAEWLISR